MCLVVRREHCPRDAKRIQRDVFGAISSAICTRQSNENIVIFIFPYPITSKIFTGIIPWSTEKQLCIFTSMYRNLGDVASARATCKKRLEVIIRALSWHIQTCFVPLELKGCVSRSPCFSSKIHESSGRTAGSSYVIRVRCLAKRSPNS